MLNQVQRGFLEASRVAHLATADRDGVPHLVPVCFALIDLSLYITVDEKPKRIDTPLKRLRNIQENPAVAVTVDRWDEDWTRLGWSCCAGRRRSLPTVRNTTERRQRFDCAMCNIERWISRGCRLLPCGYGVSCHGAQSIKPTGRYSPSARHPRRDLRGHPTSLRRRKERHRVGDIVSIPIRSNMVRPPIVSARCFHVSSAPCALLRSR